MSLPTLYELADEFKDALENLTELDDQAVVDTLESLEGEFKLKSTNVAKYIRNLEHTLEGIKEVESKMHQKRASLEKKIGEEQKFKNLLIKSLKCKNSEFDDNPEITAYLQVKDLTNKNNDEVFVFNGWTFSSSPTINPFDHPVYDIWLTKCY